ncbi:MAG: hypothetical protein ACI8X5_003209 [Planctomycetota bacterium]|jgi:hypothetical protein
MQSNTLQQTSTPSNACTQAAEVRASIRRGIETPLAALRASLEELGRGLQQGSSQANTLDRAVDLIESVGRNVQVLATLAAPTDEAPLCCTLDELARSAVRSISSTVRHRVLFAVEGASSCANVDGPGFSLWLSQLISAGVANRGEALLRTKVDGSFGVFSLVCRATESKNGVNNQELLLHVANREIQRMGGTLEHLSSPSGTTQITARLPLIERVGGAA